MRRPARQREMILGEDIFKFRVIIIIIVIAIFGFYIKIKEMQTR